MGQIDAYRWVPQVCPICEAPPTEFVGRRGGVAHREKAGVECEIWHCERCKLRFPNPMPIPISGTEQHYEVAPGEYFQHYDHESKKRSAQGLLRQAEGLTGGRGKLLDIGAGRGELVRCARQLGWDAVGIEPSVSFAEYAALYSGGEIKRGLFEHSDFAAGQFDAVVLAAVLEHLYNPDEIIRGISRILRPGGALFIDVPNEEGLYFRVGNLYEKLRGRDWTVNLSPTFSPFHVFGFGPRSLRLLLSKHGLQPRLWHVYAGRTMVPSRGGVVGMVEQLGARVVSALSKVGELGTYIETWAVKGSSAA